MGATRLPGKMMKDIAGQPVIVHVFERARLSKRAHDVWLATTVSPADDVLADWAKQNFVECYRGSEHDVLDRYYQAAKLAKAEVIVRVTGDCPLIDANVIDAVVDKFFSEKYDYASNIHPPTFPDGLDTEVVSFAALERAWQEAKLPSEREHVMPYIWKHPELFKMSNVSAKGGSASGGKCPSYAKASAGRQMSSVDTDLSRYRWTLDTPEDLIFLRRVIEACQERGHECGLSEILEIVDEHPDWQAINAARQRNEGYNKSVAEDAAKT